jgi:hypothetical protein
MCKLCFVCGVVCGVFATNVGWLAPSVATRGGGTNVVMLIIMVIAAAVGGALGFLGAVIADNDQEDGKK